ncbi:superoxide dismutase [Ni] [uncultured Sunxiuqinia sp.]|uniref:superoxide dismutase [Ni] n=1 Tax=uncultured Sunxiuqinia sp. TaxID=1573825 RepID=UPI0026278F7C|nr:superoxide dismutase [Ni] [uncultured Sunxiuqinia sp.]
MKKLAILTLFIGLLAFSQKSFAHCEIPCGIYGDSVRVTLIAEHIETLEKSMNQINELSKAGDKNYNQLVRWVVNKEEHAQKIQDIVSQYFLHQRIKPVSPTEVEAYAKYTNQLALLHQLLVYSMKAKQSTDLEVIENLRTTLEKFSHSYFHNHTH